MEEKKQVNVEEKIAKEEEKEKKSDLILQFKKLEPLLPVIFKDFDISEFIIRLQAFDRRIYNRYFKGFRVSKFNRARLIEICKKEMFDRNNEGVALFISILWNKKNHKLYQTLYNEVKKINENVEAIELIEDGKAEEILKTLLDAKFDPKKIYIAVIMNEVKFSEEFIKEKVEALIND